MESGTANLPGSPINKRINLAEAFTWPLFTISINPEVRISGLTAVALAEAVFNVSFFEIEETSFTWAMARHGQSQNSIGKRGFMNHQKSDPGLNYCRCLFLKKVT